MSRRNPFRASSHWVGLLFCFASAVYGQTGRQTVHHSLRVILDPLSSHIAVQDSITLPAGLAGEGTSFLLNDALTITSSSVPLTTLGSSDSSTAIGINSTGADTAASNRYGLTLAAEDAGPLQIAYEGAIFQQARQNSAQYSQSFSETSGIITEQGVYLNGASLWVPNFEQGDRKSVV